MLVVFVVVTAAFVWSVVVHMGSEDRAFRRAWFDGRPDRWFDGRFEDWRAGSWLWELFPPSFSPFEFIELCHQLVVVLDQFFDFLFGEVFGVDVSEAEEFEKGVDVDLEFGNPRSVVLEFDGLCLDLLDFLFLCFESDRFRFESSAFALNPFVTVFSSDFPSFFPWSFSEKFFDSFHDPTQFFVRKFFFCCGAHCRFSVCLHIT